MEPTILFIISWTFYRVHHWHQGFQAEVTAHNAAKCLTPKAHHEGCCVHIAQILILKSSSMFPKNELKDFFREHQCGSGLITQCLSLCSFMHLSGCISRVPRKDKPHLLQHSSALQSRAPTPRVYPECGKCPHAKLRLCLLLFCLWRFFFSTVRASEQQWSCCIANWTPIPLGKLIIHINYLNLICDYFSIWAVISLQNKYFPFQRITAW